jgi:hypothetical protein
MVSTNNTDIRTAMSPRKKAWLRRYQHNFISKMKDEDECLEASDLLRRFGGWSSIAQKQNHKFLFAKKAFWICSHNGDKEGCYKWYEKAKERGLEFMDSIGDMTDQNRVLTVSHDEDTHRVLSEEGQDNAYMKAGKSLKNAVDNMEWVLKNMPQ